MSEDDVAGVVGESEEDDLVGSVGFGAPGMTAPSSSAVMSGGQLWSHTK